MEARLFADLARYRLANKAWEIPEVVQKGKKIVCGIIAEPNLKHRKYTDCINRAAKGWQLDFCRKRLNPFNILLKTFSFMLW